MLSIQTRKWEQVDCWADSTTLATKAQPFNYMAGDALYRESVRIDLNPTSTFVNGTQWTGIYYISEIEGSA